MPRGKKSSVKKSDEKKIKKTKKRGRPKKINPKDEKKIADELDRIKKIVEAEDDDEVLQVELDDIKSNEKQRKAKLAEMEDKNKKLLMWIGVVFVMMVVIIFWVINLDVITSKGFSGKGLKIDSVRVEETKKELIETLGSIKKSLNDMKEQAEKIKQEEGIESVTDQFEDNEISNVNISDKIEEVENNVEIE